MSFSPTAGATRNVSAHSSARGASWADCAQISTMRPQRCSRSLRRTGRTRGYGPAPTPTSSPTVSSYFCSTASVVTQVRPEAGGPDQLVRPTWHARQVKRAVLIVNPFASRVTDERIAAVERALMGSAYLRTVRTERAQHAIELARDAGDADALIVFSGDGGFNEVLNGVVRDDQPIGFIPGGGTSVLPRALGLPRDPVAAAERLAV